MLKKQRKKLSRMMHIIFTASGDVLMTYGFILCFRTQDDLNSVYELLKEKSSILDLRKYSDPINVLHHFTLVIECRGDCRKSAKIGTFKIISITKPICINTSILDCRF